MEIRTPDTYNPNNTVQPTVTSPANEMQVSTSPNQFGAQIGQALGGTQQKLDKFSDEALSYQNLLTETKSLDSSTKYATAVADLRNEFSQLGELDAVNRRPEYEQKISLLRDHFRGQLPLVGQHLFDQFSNRDTINSLNDISGHAAQQLRAYHVNVRQSSIELAKTKLADTSVAGNPYEMGRLIGGIKHDIIAQMQIEEAAGISEDPETHQPVFNNDAEGQHLQAIYQARLDKELGPAIISSVQTVWNTPSLGGPDAAWKLLQEDPDIPAPVRSEAISKLNPQYRAHITKINVNNLFNEWNSKWLDQNAKGFEGQSWTSETVGHVLDQTERTPEGQVSPAGAKTSHQIMPDTFDGVAKQHPELHLKQSNRQDWDTVQRLLVQDSMKKYPNDPERWAIAYAGSPEVMKVYDKEGMRGLAGIPMDKTNPGGESVAQYVTRFMSNLGIQKTVDGKIINYMPRSVFFEQHQAEMLNEVRDQTASQFAGDSEMDDRTLSNFNTEMNIYASQDRKSDYANMYQVRSIINDAFQKGQPIQDVYQFTSGALGAEAQQAWFNLNPFYQQGIERLIDQDLRGTAKDYGPNFDKWLGRIIEGKVTDPGDMIPDIGDTKGYGLSNSGFRTLSNIINQMGQTQNGRVYFPVAFSALQALKKQVLRGPGPYGTDAQKLWNDMLPGLVTQIMEHQEKNDLSIFNPKDQKNYFGTNALHNALPINKVIQDQLSVVKPPKEPPFGILGKNWQNMTNFYFGPKPFDAGTIKTRDDLINAVKSGKLTDRKQFDDIAKKHPDWLVQAQK